MKHKTTIANGHDANLQVHQVTKSMQVDCIFTCCKEYCKTMLICVVYCIICHILNSCAQCGIASRLPQGRGGPPPQAPVSSLSLRDTQTYCPAQCLFSSLSTEQYSAVLYAFGICMSAIFQKSSAQSYICEEFSL